jgi:hypothetical protein
MPRRWHLRLPPGPLADWILLEYTYMMHIFGTCVYVLPELLRQLRE